MVAIKFEGPLWIDEAFFGSLRAPQSVAKFWVFYLEKRVSECNDPAAKSQVYLKARSPGKRSTVAVEAAAARAARPQPHSPNYPENFSPSGSRGEEKSEEPAVNRTPFYLFAPAGGGRIVPRDRARSPSARLTRPREGETDSATKRSGISSPLRSISGRRKREQPRRRTD